MDDNTAKLLRLIAGLTGAVVAGESLALLVGMHVFAKAEAWIDTKNIALALFDVAVGVGLVILALGRGAPSFSFFVRGALLVAAMTHVYRVWEYLVGSEGRFFFNLPLLAFCVLRLLGLVAILVLGRAR
jgi:hypothetical protein